MIKSLHLHNFQSHKESHLDFSDGINVIIGTSDSGKTAVLRGLNWLVNNRPTGDGFVRNGCAKAEVICNTEMDCIIRSKSKSENTYMINSKELKAFGTDVPEVVGKALNFSELNIQYQLDSPFLLSESSGEAGRILNKVVKIDNIDKSLQRIESRKRKARQEEEFLAQEITKQESGLEKYKDLNQAAAKADGIAMNMQKLEQLQTKYQKNREVLEEITALQKMNQKFGAFESIYLAVGAADNLYQNWQKLDEKAAKLFNLIKERKEIESALVGYCEMPSVHYRLAQCIVLVGSFEYIKEKHDQVTGLISEKKSIINEMKTTETRIILVKEQLEQIMPDVCPLCKQEIKK